MADEKLEEYVLPPSTGFVKLAKMNRPEWMWFYQRPDGSVISLTEKEAYWVGKHFFLLGCSDGKTYVKYINEHVKKEEIISKEDAGRIMQEAFDAELAVAKGKYKRPTFNPVHFDDSFPIEQRGTFVPPK